MHKQVMEHLKLYEGIRKAKLPWAALKYGNSQEVIEICSKVIDGKIEAVSQMPKEVVQYLFLDKEFIDKIGMLLKEGTSLTAIIALIDGAGKERLSCFDTNILKDVLSDGVILQRNLFLYLKYFYKCSLTDQQKQDLNSGIRFFMDYINAAMGDFHDSERKIFYEPIMASYLLRDVVATKEDIMELLKPDLLHLLNELDKYVPYGNQLGEVQWNQLKKEPEVIHTALRKVISCMKPEDIPKLLVFWLENETLKYDIYKLAKELPQRSEEERHQISQNKTSYISTIYGTSIEGIPLEGLEDAKEKLLIYAITNKKKHFLSLVRRHADDFRELPRFSILFDPDVYRHYLNINTMNDKDFESCFLLKRLDKELKQYMVYSSYLFSELAILSGVTSTYLQLFHKLKYQRSDDRLRVFRELVKKRCIPILLEAEEMESLGNMLSQKALSHWLQDELVHIKGIYPDEAIHILCHWEMVKRFIPDIKDSVQMKYLLNNVKILEQYTNFQELQKQVLYKDRFWLDVQQNFQVKEEFITQYRENILHFLYEGGAEVIHVFSQNRPDKKEQIRRILMAELMGRFSELKYHKGDLQKEIDFPITESICQTWQENSESVENGIRIWEEDRMLPTMQIGEVPSTTCLSYRDGVYNECLLSCFDSNKKVMQAYTDGRIVLRAMIRLTKGCFVHTPEGTSDVEFVDLTGEPKEPVKEKRNEELVLFLERPYSRWISEEKERVVVSMLCELLQKKALKLGARFMISDSYRNCKMKEKGYVLSGYSMYISASKNGSSYLDSLGGKATVSSSRSYERNRFWMLDFNNRNDKAA